MTNTGLTSIKGLGPKRVEALKLAGIQTAQDFLYYLPREYRDLTRITPAVRAARRRAVRHARMRRHSGRDGSRGRRNPHPRHRFRRHRGAARRVV